MNVSGGPGGGKPNPAATIGKSALLHVSHQAVGARKVIIHVPQTSTLGTMPIANDHHRQPKARGLIFKPQTKQHTIQLKLNQSVVGTTHPDEIIKCDNTNTLSIPLTLKTDRVLSNGGEGVTASKHGQITNDYRELFAALFKIKDVRLTARIMKAINAAAATTERESTDGEERLLCAKCQEPLERQVNGSVKLDDERGQSDASTQTEYINLLRHRTIKDARTNGTKPASTRTRRPKEPHAVPLGATQCDVEHRLESRTNPKTDVSNRSHTVSVCY